MTKKNQPRKNMSAATNMEELLSGDKQITPAYFPTAETERQLMLIQDAVGVNAFNHGRVITPPLESTVVRDNRDVYLSIGLVDIREGATVVIPEIEADEYLSVMPVTYEHRVQPMLYAAGEHELRSHNPEHDYMGLVLRIGSNVTQERAHELQDAVIIRANSAVPFTAEAFDGESHRRVERELQAKFPAHYAKDPVNAIVGMFTSPSDPSGETFDQFAYEVGAAIGWGGAQMVDNIYEVTGNYDSSKCYVLNFEDPKHGAFWSVSAYDGTGYYFNEVSGYNSWNAKPNADGSYTIHFGCGEDAINNIPTANESGEFNLGIRHYRPSEAVQNGLRLAPGLTEKHIVTEENFSHAETARNFKIWTARNANQDFIKMQGLPPRGKAAPTVQMNDDTLYGVAIVKAVDGKVSFSLPETDVYLAVQVITERGHGQHYVVEDGEYNLTVESDYAFLVYRSGTEKGIEASIAALDKVDTSAFNFATDYQVQPYDYDEVEAWVKRYTEEVNNTKNFVFDMPRTSDQVTDLRKWNQMNAAGWGAATPEPFVANMYFNSLRFSGDACYTTTFKDPQNKFFTSITPYDTDKYLIEGAKNVNSHTWVKNSDGTITVSFNCGADAKNNIDTKGQDFTFTTRHYGAHPDVIAGGPDPIITNMRKQ